MVAEYQYNARGHQVVRKLNGQGVTIHAVYDFDGNRVAEYNAENGQLLAEYVWLNGTPLAVISGGVTYYVRSDHIGKPVFATDGTGAKVWSATYKPFGEVDTSTGTPINLRHPRSRALDKPIPCHGNGPMVLSRVRPLSELDARL